MSTTTCPQMPLFTVTGIQPYCSAVNKVSSIPITLLVGKSIISDAATN